jgi:hypothetical protein
VTGIRPDERCHLSFDVDGTQVTRLFAHVHSGTAMKTIEYAAENRVVLDLGDRFAGGVALFLGSAELARLIDLLNDAYTRVAPKPYADVPRVRGAA